MPLESRARSLSGSWRTRDEHGAIGKRQQEAIAALRQAALKLQRVSASMAVALEKMTPEPKVRRDRMR